jgi:hypothetical protein
MVQFFNLTPSTPILYVYNWTMLATCVKIHPHLSVIHITITKRKWHDVCEQFNKYAVKQPKTVNSHTINFDFTITMGEL